MRLNTDSLPYPMAASYRRIGACHDRDATRFRYVLQTAEMTARYLAISVICDLRDRWIKAHREGRADIFLPPLSTPFLKASERLTYPSFGTWVTLMGEGTRCWTGEVDGNEHPPFIPGLRNALFPTDGSVGQLIHLFNSLVASRNRWAHNKIGKAALGKECGDCEQQVDQLLRGLSFLEEYAPYYVRRIDLKQRRLKRTRYTHKFLQLTGAYQSPMAHKEMRTSHTETEEMILEGPDKEHIHLDPLLLYLDSDSFDDPHGLKPDLYIFDGYEQRGTRLVLSYLPCGSYGRAFKTNKMHEDMPDEPAMPAEDQELLERGMQELLDFFTPEPRG